MIAPRARAKVAAFYHYARAADDVADDPGLPATTKLTALDRFETALNGGPGAPEARRLRETLADTPQMLRQAQALLGAFRQDARGATYRNRDDLLAYCTMSAAPVGRFLLYLHEEDPETARYSDPLCIALQILNHLQDLRQDRDRLGRVYLPQEWLHAAGASEHDLSRTALSGPARAVVDRALDECRDLLERAAPLPRRIRSTGLRGQAAATLWLARRLGAKLRTADPLEGRVALTRSDFVRAGLIGLLVAARGR